MSQVRQIDDQCCEGLAPKPIASVVVVATNELHHLERLLPSLQKLEGCTCEVVVIDNASTDFTSNEVRSRFPWVVLIRSERRLGYAAANNLGFSRACGEYIIVLNPDTDVGRDFVTALVQSSRRNQDRSLITSLVCMFDDHHVVNACGNVVHFALIAGCRGIGKSADTYMAEEEVASISGCAFLIPRKVLDSIGNFDESTFLYLEDTELSLRAWLCGYSVRTCPESRVFHQYQLKMTPQKFHLIERNRWVVMLRTYRVTTLALLLPALLLIELLAWAIAIRMGRQYFVSKSKSLWGVVLLAPGILRSRRSTQLRRVASDAGLLRVLQGDLPVKQLISGGWLGASVVRLANVAFVIYFALVRAIVR